MEIQNIKYTSAALAQLEKFKEQQANKLEEQIVENKKYIGADFIEITASDIQEEARKFSYRKPPYKGDIKYLITYTYLLSGIGLTLFGFLYQDIIDIWQNQPRQSIYILTGLIMTFISVILFYIIKSKETRRFELADPFHKGEKIFIAELLRRINEEPTQPSIIILSATYEWATGQRDVTDKIKELVSKGIYTIVVDPSTFGMMDPAQGVVKTLKLHCKINGHEKEFIQKDGERFHIR